MESNNYMFEYYLYEVKYIFSNPCKLFTFTFTIICKSFDKNINAFSLIKKNVFCVKVLQRSMLSIDYSLKCNSYSNIQISQTLKTAMYW